MGSGIVGLRLPHTIGSIGGTTTTTINVYTAYGYEIDVVLEDEDEIYIDLVDEEIEVELED